MPPKGIDQNWLNIYTMLTDKPNKAEDTLKTIIERQHQSPALKNTIKRIIPLEHPETHETLLDKAASLQLLEHMRHLFALGANPNQPDTDGNTTLIKTTIRDQGTGESIPIIRLLVEHGADPLKANHAGQTAWSIAQTYDRPRRYNTVLHFQTIAFIKAPPLPLSETETIPFIFVARYLDERSRDVFRLTNKALAEAIPPSGLQQEWRILCERNPVIRPRRQNISWQAEYEEESQRKSEKVVQLQ